MAPRIKMIVIKTYFGAVVVKRCDVSTCHDRSWSRMSLTHANLYMEHFEQLALSTAPHPPSLWLRYFDDTYVRIHEYDVEGFTRHINNIDDNIKFTIEPETNSKLPFLDLCTHILDDGSTKLTIYRNKYRKP